MKNAGIKLGIIVLLLFNATTGPSQEYRLGGSAIYNFKTKGLGLGLRAEFPLKSVTLLEGLSIVPQASYFPAFNKISEFYIGSSVHLGVYSLNKWAFYSLANISYKGWINYKDSDNQNAKFSNMSLEAGLGVTRKTCLRPFLEFRLNVIGFEPNLRIGVLYTFNCDKRGMVPCSKVPPPPQF